MKIKLHTNQIEDLDQALELSKQVFKPSSPEELKKYHNKDDWRKKIIDHGLLTTAWIGDKMVGFSVCYSNGSEFHIWVVGVIEEFRKLGIWKLIYREILKRAKILGFKTITINTYKEKFPVMYSFVTSNGYKEYKIEKGKSYFTKRI